MKTGESLLVMMAVAAIAVVPADIFYTSRFVPRFKDFERQRIVTSNQLATAKIVSENLNHVRDLVYRNMEFADQKDTVTHESLLFEFLTSCVNDLKMRLVSVRPSQPIIQGRVTVYGYDIILEGDFFSFGELCSKFENSRKVMAMTSFDVNQVLDSRVDQSAKDGKTTPSAPGRRGITIKLHLDTYRVKKG